MTEYEDAYHDDDEDLYEDDELAEIAELLEAQKEEAAWAAAQERFEQRLGRKLTRREIDGMNQHDVEYDGGDPVETVKKTYEGYYAESGQTPYENRPRWTVGVGGRLREPGARAEGHAHRPRREASSGEAA